MFELHRGFAVVSIYILAAYCVVCVGVCVCVCVFKLSIYTVFQKTL